MTTRARRRTRLVGSPSLTTVQRTMLRTVLRIDGAHVSALAAVALTARLTHRHRPNRTPDGLAASAAVAALGFALAAIAVKRSETTPTAGGSLDAEARPGSPATLIALGGAINTVGAAWIGAAWRDDRPVVLVSAGLLIGGDVLTVLYLLGMSRPRTAHRRLGRLHRRHSVSATEPLHAGATTPASSCPS